MIASGIVCLFLAWVISSFLRLERQQTGAVILCSGFGSSTFLGYAVVSEVFPRNVTALSDAVVASEFGVGLMLFTIGVMLAMHFGSTGINTKDQFRAIGGFFRSPIFFALVLGIAFSFVSPARDAFLVSTIYKFLDIVAHANTLLVALTIGVMLRFRGFSRIGLILAGVCIIKLILQPVLAGVQSQFLPISPLEQEILFLESAMPSATMAAVFSRRYGCDGELAARVVLGTTICSIATILILSYSIQYI
jgi:predicted permease